MRVSRDGRGEIWLTDVQKKRILGLARRVPRDELFLGLQLERGWRIGSIVGCRNKVTYTRKRTGERVVSIVDLPGIRKEDVGEETIMNHFKGGKTVPDYPGRKWLRLAQKLASKAQMGERIISLRTTWNKHPAKICKTRGCSRLGSSPQSSSTCLFRDILG